GADLEAEELGVEGHAAVDVHDRDGGVIVANNARSGSALPLWIADARWKKDQLQRVPFGIAELEGAHAASVSRQTHRCTVCDVPPRAALQLLPGARDVTADESEMLKPLIV